MTVEFGLALENFTPERKVPDMDAVTAYSATAEELGFASVWAWDHLFLGARRPFPFLEALTTLYMLTNGALFMAWETGRLPTAACGAVEGANLRPEELPVPEGKPAPWDPARQAAVSEAYGTIHFATPLIELPIDKISEVERDEYGRFRAEYLGLWRQYFDPIGMRFSIDG